MPKLSIITINLNDAAGLLKTIESVRAQTYRDFEHIIIDGGSTDESINVIKKFESGLAYWVSEPDGGIYQGMNKGTKIAKGEYGLYLNSGDFLYNSKVLENLFKEKFREDFVYGDWIQEKSKKRILRHNRINFFNFSLCQQSVLIKFSLLKKLNGYDEQFKFTSDWNFFMLAIFAYGASYRYIPIKISVYNSYGITANKQNHKFIWQEIAKIQKKILPNFSIRLEMIKLLSLNKIGETKFKNVNFNMQNRIKNRDVYVWGTGFEAAKVLDLLEKKSIRVEAFLDSNKEFHGLAFSGYKIHMPEQILTHSKENIFIVIASKRYRKEIAEICKNYGLEENKDFYVPFRNKDWPFPFNEPD
jgi:glycosyltransferase involved in cell wall biosynthesis